MEIKQVIVIAKLEEGGAVRLVFDAEGKCIRGDAETLSKSLGGTIVVRGQKGESIRAIVDGDGNSDNPVVNEILEGFSFAPTGVTAKSDDNKSDDESDDDSNDNKSDGTSAGLGGPGSTE